MAGTVFLITDRFEVKLEGITFKLRDFEPLCTMDFLFPRGMVWLYPPIVGIDVLRHPRDPRTALLLLCFGIGCVILRFHLGDQLPDPILRFLQDKRIRFVGFGIPEKKDLFPFGEIGLKESQADVGYLAARALNDPKLKKSGLAELARKVIGIKKMVGLADARALGRHEQIKCAICEVYLSSVIAMMLLDPNNENRLVNSAKKGIFTKMILDPNNMNKLASSPKKSLFAKNVELPSFPPSGWSKIFTSTRENHHHEPQDEGGINNVQVRAKGKEGASREDAAAVAFPGKQPLKGILKCSSSNSLPQLFSPPKPMGQPNLRRANSKGHNVSFLVNNTVRMG